MKVKKPRQYKLIFQHYDEIKKKKDGSAPAKENQSSTDE